MPSSRAMRRCDQPRWRRDRMVSIMATLSRLDMAALVEYERYSQGYLPDLRLLKVAGFQAPIGGWFWAPADKPGIGTKPRRPSSGAASGGGGGSASASGVIESEARPRRRGSRSPEGGDVVMATSEANDPLVTSRRGLVWRMVLSMLTGSGDEAAETLPAVSVAWAVMECAPLARTGLVKDQAPSAPAVVVPRRVPSEKRLTVLPASAVPVNVGVLSAVTLSVLETPVSLDAARYGVEGAAGAVVSIVTARAPEVEETLPATSVARAVML